MYIDLLIGCLWFCIGTISFVFGEKYDPCRTRGEYVINLFLTGCLGPITTLIVISHSNWWNEEI